MKGQHISSKSSTEALCLSADERMGKRRAVVDAVAIIELCADDGSGRTAVATGEFVMDVDVLRYVIVFAYQSHRSDRITKKRWCNRKKFCAMKARDFMMSRDELSVVPRAFSAV